MSQLVAMIVMVGRSKKILQPRGAWIWYLSKIRKDYIKSLEQVNCTRVYLKSLDDASNSVFWSLNCSKKHVGELNDNGISVWGWGYIFDARAKTNTDAILRAVEQTIRNGCSGFVFDVESEIKKKVTHAQLADILTRAHDIVPPGSLGYTSFGHPGFHPEIPWKLLYTKCDLQFPQMYYEKWTFGASNDDEVRAAMRAHDQAGLSGKPILPIWGSESDTPGEHRTSPKELQSFLDKHPGSSVWRIPHREEYGEAWSVNYRGTDVSAPTTGRSYKPAPIPLPSARILAFGMEGEDLYILACALIGLGFMTRRESVGILFDSEIQAAVLRAQRTFGLDADGIVGEETRAALEKALEAARQ